jgi:hypothetical protein
VKSEIWHYRKPQTFFSQRDIDLKPIFCPRHNYKKLNVLVIQPSSKLGKKQMVGKIISYEL